MARPPAPLRGRRLTTLAVQAALTVLVPAVAWTATVPHAEFRAGDPIVAEELNENFDALAQAVTELEAVTRNGPVLSDAANFTLQPADGSQPVPALDVQIATDSGVVKLELTAVLGGGEVRLEGAGYAWIVFRRSPDGKDWTNLTYLAQQTDGLLGLPPGAFTFFDEPGVGTWHYDVHAATFQSATLQFAGVRLVAQSLGGAP